jgi:prepilin-type processing-associated H-X9-DG protein
MLVVATVITAILFPIVTAPGPKPYAISCLMHEKEIGLGLLQYQEDYDGKFPGGLNGYGGGSGWAGQVYPYVRDTRTFGCPSDDGDRTRGAITSDPPVRVGAGGPWRASSYAINSNVTLPNPTMVGCDQRGDSVSIGKFTAPANTVLVFEVINSTNYNVDTETNTAAQTPPGAASNCGASPSGDGIGGFYAPNGYNNRPGAGGFGNDGRPGNDNLLQYNTGVLNGEKADLGSFADFAGPHAGGANYVMADGHAKWLLPGAVSPGQNAVSAKAAQIDHIAVGDHPHAAGAGGKFSDHKAVPAATFSII